MKTLLAHIPGAKKALAVLMAFSFADAACTAGQALTLAWALALLWYGKGLAEALPFVGAFAICYLVRQATSAWKSRYASRFAHRSSRDLLEQLAAHAFDAGAGAAHVRGTGSTATLFIEGIAQVENYLGLILPKMADLMVVPAALTVALFACDAISGVIALAMLPCIVLYMRMLGANAKEAAAKQHGRFQIMSNHFIDTLRGMSTLKLLGASKGYERQVFDVSEKFREATMNTIKTATLSSLILDLFRTFALAAIAIMLGFRLMAGDIPLFNAMAVLIMVPEFFAAIRRYSTDFHASLDGRNQLASILDYLAEPLVQAPKLNCVQWDEASAALTLSNIGFSYGENGKAAKGFALHDIDLRIPKGASVGIVGASGSGKSTLAQLLAGFSSPSRGSFAIGKDTMKTLAWDGWRSHVMYLPQSPHLFGDTLAANISFYQPNATREQITNAAQAMGLGELVASLSDGLDTVIGEGGRQLSGGQAQRVALARAFLDDRDVLVFDEPTSHLDIETELALSESMLDLMNGRTTIMTTHRIFWMRQMDWLVVLEEGRIAQQGTFDQLIGQPGVFRTLVSTLAGDEVA